MDQRELEEFEDELRVLQFRVEQSIRLFFQNQRALFLENFRSTNDLRTSLESTVISGTGNSNNPWQIYLAEEPVEFNWFQYLCIAFLVWLIIAVFHIMRKCNEPRREPYNSRNIRCAPINVSPPNNDNKDNELLVPPNNDNEEPDNGEGNVNQPLHELQLAFNNDNEDETNGQGNENEAPYILVYVSDNENEDENNGQGHEHQPINVLPPNNDNEDDNNGQSNENQAINVLPPNNDNEDENNGQGNENPPINVLPPNNDNEDENNGQGNENPSINVLPPPNNDNEDENNGQGNENPPINVLPSNNDNEDENNGQDNENQPINVLPPNNDNEDEINGEINENLPIIPLNANRINRPITPVLLQYNNDNEKEINNQGNGNIQALHLFLLASNNDNGDKINDQRIENQPNDENENNSQENENGPIGALLPSLNDVNNEENNSEQQIDINNIINELKKEMAKGFKNVLNKIEQWKQASESETGITKKENNDTDETAKQDIAEKSEPQPSGSKVKYCSPKSQKATEVRTPDQRKDAANQTEDEVKSEKIEKKLSNGSTNEHQKASSSSSCDEATKIDVEKVQQPDLIKESKPLPSDSKINDSAKSENATAIKVFDDHTIVVVKTDNKNIEAIKPDSKNGSMKEDEEKSICSSSVVVNNEDVKTLKRNSTEKPNENKDNDSKPNESDVTEDPSTLPSDRDADNVLKSEDKERKVSMEKDSKDNLLTLDPEEPTDSSSKRAHDEGVQNTKENTTKVIATGDFSRNKNDDCKEDKNDVEKPKDFNIIEDSKELPSESKTSDLPKSQNVVATKTSDHHAGEVLKAKDNENKDSVQKDSKNVLNTSNQVQIKSSEISDDHKDEVIKTEDKEKTDSIERDSKGGSVNKDQEEPKDVSLTVAKNEDVENVIENNMEANVQCRENEGNLKINEEKPDDTDQSKALPSENKTKISTKSQNANAVETPDHIDELIEKYSKCDLTNQDGGDSKDSSAVGSKNENVKNSVENNEENLTEKSTLEKDEKSGDIDQSTTSLSENKPSNSPKSQNVITTNTSESTTDEVVKTENEEKKDLIEKDSKDGLKNEDQEESKDLTSVVAKNEDVQSALENNMNTNTTEKLDGNKAEDNKESEVALLEKESSVGNTEKSVENVSETSDSHKDEVVKTEDEEKKTDDTENALESKMETNATEVLSENKIAGNIEDKSDLEKGTEIDNIEESATLTSETSNSPKSQNVTETPGSHTDEVVKTEDEEKKDLMEKHVEGGLVNADQEISTSSATENLSENKNDDGKEDDDAVQKESKVDHIEEFKTLPSENKTSTSPKTQHYHQTDEVVKTEDEKNNSLEKDSKDGLISESQESTDFPENNKNASRDKIDEGNENLDDAEKVPKDDKIEELTILPSDSRVSNSSESHNITVTETPDLHTDEIIKADDEKTKETIKKNSINSLMNEEQKESESTSLDVVDNNLEASETEKLSEKKTGDNMENKDGVQHVTEADIIEESKGLPSETSTFEHREEEIVKNENVEKKLEEIAEQSETNAADNENKKIQSEDSKESLSNEDKIFTENSTGEANEEECDLALQESKIGDISNLQSEIAITSSNLDKSFSDSDTENQASSSTPNNSSGNDQLLGGQRKNQKKKKGKKSKHNRY